MRPAESDSHDCIGAPKNRGPLAAVGALGCSLVSLVLNPTLLRYDRRRRELDDFKGVGHFEAKF